jgi:hypothetical protein
MEALCSSETLVSTYKSTRRYNSEDRHRKFTDGFYTCEDGTPTVGGFKVYDGVDGPDRSSSITCYNFIAILL